MIKAGRDGMPDGCIVILDVGKTNAKLTLWSRDGRRLATSMRANADVSAGSYRALDTDGVRVWLKATLRTFSRDAKIEAIVPVSHGAAAAVIAGELLAPPMSYETSFGDM